MVRLGRAKTGHPAAVIVLALAMLAPAAAAAKAAPAAGCRVQAQRYLAHRKALRLTDRRIIGWLNTGRYRRAVAALHPAIRAGDPWAGRTLGHLYAAGLGVGRSAKTAVHWYRWAAKRGDRFAQRQLANAYLNGVGVARNPARAAYWFRIGIAPYQLALSDYVLAAMYASGTLAPVNRGKEKHYLHESLHILRRLAREPNGAANFYLGVAYAQGHGVARDRTKALAHLCRALALGYGPAAPLIGKLERPR